MTRNFKGGSQYRIDVYLKPTEGSPACGASYLAKDVPTSPLNDSHSTISFWVGDKLMIYPMDMIDHCELYEV